MKSLLITACVLLASTMASAQDSIVELQKEKVKLLKENRDELSRSASVIGSDPREIDAAGRKLIEARLELAALEGDTKTAIALYRELIVQGKETVTYLKRQVERGNVSQMEVDKARAEVIKAELELAALEGDTMKAVSLHRELVVQADETARYSKRQMQKGNLSAIEVRKAEVELIDRKIGLAKAEKAAKSPAP
jgi:hypothetical protein